MKLDKRKKIIIGIILLIILCIGIIVGVLLLNNKEEQKDEKVKDTILLKEDLKFEINSEVKLLSLVSEDNKVKILSEDETIDTSTLGEKEVTIKYEEEDKEETKIFKITIVDTQAPTIEYQKELSTTIDKKIDLLKGVKVTDNSKEEIKANVEKYFKKSKRPLIHDLMHSNAVPLHLNARELFMQHVDRNKNNLAVKCDERIIG